MAIDLETTGLTPGYHEITEIGCMLLGQYLDTIDTFHSFVKINYPERGLENLIDDKKNNRKINVFEYTHINPKKLTKAPSPIEVAQSFLSWIKKHTGEIDKRDICLFGQNTKFDENFLRIMIKTDAKELWPFDYHVISLDSVYFMYYYKKYGKLPPSISLRAMCEEFKIINLKEHAATQDMTTSVALLRCLSSYLRV